jgi:hypothetical protein
MRFLEPNIAWMADGRDTRGLVRALRHKKADIQRKAALALAETKDIAAMSELNAFLLTLAEQADSNTHSFLESLHSRLMPFTEERREVVYSHSYGPWGDGEEPTPYQFTPSEEAGVRYEYSSHYDQYIGGQIEVTAVYTETRDPGQQPRETVEAMLRRWDAPTRL